jgi:hypothetical protein
MNKAIIELQLSKRPTGVCVLLLAVLCSGCAGDNKPAGSSAQATKATLVKNSQAPSGVPTAQVPKSVFTLDQSSRDPFFPQAKKAIEASTTIAVPVTNFDIPTLLNAGLQGIGGTTSRRIAIINNILLEPGRKAVIPLRVGNQTRSVSVRCREIAKNSVVLEVEGYGPLTLKPKETL